MTGGWYHAPKATVWTQTGYHQWQQDLRKRDISRVKCFTCNKHGQISHYCPQRCNGNMTKAQATPMEPEGETPLEWANAWLPGVGGGGDKVKNLILQTMWKDEDFPNTWTWQPGWGHFTVTLYMYYDFVQWRSQFWYEPVTARPICVSSGQWSHRQLHTSEIHMMNEAQHKGTP